MCFVGSKPYHRIASFYVIALEASIYKFHEIETNILNT